MNMVERLAREVTRVPRTLLRDGFRGYTAAEAAAIQRIIQSRTATAEDRQKYREQRLITAALAVGLPYPPFPLFLKPTIGGEPPTILWDPTGKAHQAVSQEMERLANLTPEQLNQEILDDAQRKARYLTSS